MKRTTKDDFEYFAKAPDQWLLKGQTLYRASMQLFNCYKSALEALDTLDHTPIDEGASIIADNQMFEPAAMLAGYCLEVTFKAAIVAKCPHVVKRGMKGKDWVKRNRSTGHELVTLANKAGIKSIDDSLLETLEQFLVWKGLYPSNLSGKTMYGMQSELENFSGTHWLKLMDQFSAAYISIRGQVKTAIKEQKGKSD